MAPPIKKNGTQIASCLRFKDKNGKLYFRNGKPVNRKARRHSERNNAEGGIWE